MSRMALDNVVKGKLDKPFRLVVTGTEGVGKSTFASEAPNPIFIAAEDGTAQLDVVRFPSPNDWDEAKECMRVLRKETHEYQTIVIDTLDWLEPLCWASVCKELDVSSIADADYGRGYTAAVDQWRLFLASLDRLRMEKNMNVIAIAHTHIKGFKNPEGLDYDRYELKLHAKTAGLWKEWSDAVLHCKFETFVSELKGRKRGISSGKRIICTERTAAYDAKNRYNLPNVMPLHWATFAAALKSGETMPVADAMAMIEELAAKTDEAIRKEAAKYVKAAAGDSRKLAQIVNWLKNKVVSEEEETVDDDS